MDAKLLDLLREADDPVHWECPPRFPWRAELERVEALQPVLEETIGHKLILDRNVQDASYFAELLWHAEPRAVAGVGQNVILAYLGIRFSAFGRLVALWGNVPEEPLGSELAERVSRILTSNGYTVLNAVVLDEPYDGPNESASHITTWWHRYFDYC